MSQVVISDSNMSQINDYIGVDVQMLFPQTHLALYTNQSCDVKLHSHSDNPDHNTHSATTINSGSWTDDDETNNGGEYPLYNGGTQLHIIDVDDDACSLSISCQKQLHQDPLNSPRGDPDRNPILVLDTKTTKIVDYTKTLIASPQPLDELVEANHHGLHVLNQLNASADASVIEVSKAKFGVTVIDPTSGHCSPNNNNTENTNINEKNANEINTADHHIKNNSSNGNENETLNMRKLPKGMTVQLLDDQSHDFTTIGAAGGPAAMTPRSYAKEQQRREDDKIAQAHLEQQKEKLQVERIVVRKPQRPFLGNYRIDRHGRIIILADEPSPPVGMTPSQSSSNVQNNAESTNLRDDSVSAGRRESNFANNNIRTGRPQPATPTYQPPIFDPRILQRNMERERKWIQMVEEWDHIKPDTLKRRVRKGIPSSMRSVVWPKLMGLEEARAKYPPRYYYDLLSRPVTEQCEVQIRKDLPRLMQDNVMFQSPEAGSRTVMCSGQAMLYNILKAYSVHDPEVGYVQGMDSATAVSIQYFPEETSFWFLHQLLSGERYNLRGVYIDGFPLARKYVYIHEQLVKKFLPQLYKVMTSQCIQHNGYAFRWYTMRYGQFAPELAYRVMDIYLLEGDKILYRVALALLQIYEQELLSDPDSMLEKLMKIDLDVDLHAMGDGSYVLDKALKISLTTAHLNKFAKEYELLPPDAGF